MMSIYEKESGAYRYIYIAMEFSDDGSDKMKRKQMLYVQQLTFFELFYVISVA